MIRFKQNGFKRALALLLSVFMAMSALSVTVFADEALSWTISTDYSTATMTVGGATLTYYSTGKDIYNKNSYNDISGVTTSGTNGYQSNGIVTSSGNTYACAYYTAASDGTLTLYVNSAASDKYIYISKTSSGGESTSVGNIVSDGSATFNTSEVVSTYASSIHTVNIEVEKDYTYYICLTGSKMILYYGEFVPYTTVSGTITDSNNLGSYSLKFTNTTTKAVTTVEATGTSYSVLLKPGYTYTAALTGNAALSYAITSNTKSITVEATEDATQTANLTIEERTSYIVSGSLNNISEGNLSDLELTFTPTDTDSYDPVEAEINTSEYTYSATLVAGASYTVSKDGAYDYDLADTYTVSGTTSDPKTQDISFAALDTYSVSGSFLGLTQVRGEYETLGSVEPSAITFKNVDDGYVYSGTPTAGSYTASLRTGSYLASITSNDYSTSTHVVVGSSAVERDLLLKDESTKTVAYSETLYVGSNRDYKTVQAAVDAVANMERTDNARVTIKIDPGTYREQVVINEPNITLESNGGSADDTIITWYYGIGYQYYSCVDSYYDPYADYDQYEKGDVVSYWGSAVITNEKAEGFQAEGITFENSFNKYMTQEEIDDGVAEDSLTTTSITFDRTSLDADVDSYSATERAAALVNYADNVEFKDCSFISSQDTLMTGNRGYHSLYFKNCYIEGQTDFIYGNGDVIFDGCELNFCGYDGSTSTAYLTANSSYDSYKAEHGYIFRSCYISYSTERDVTPSYFGRPWQEGAAVTFLNTQLQEEDMILAKGWTSMSVDPDTSDTVRYYEYNTTYDGTAVDTSGRAAKSTILTSETYDASAYSVETVLTSTGNWTPEYYDTDVTNTDPTFSTSPDLSSDEIDSPDAGDTVTVSYVISESDNDASRISWYAVDSDYDTTETDLDTILESATLLYTTSAVSTNSYVIPDECKGSYLMAVVTPITNYGLEGEAAYAITSSPVSGTYEEVNEVTLTFNTQTALDLYETNASTTFTDNVYSGEYTNDDNQTFDVSVYQNGIKYYSSNIYYGTNAIVSSPIFSFTADEIANYTVSWEAYGNGSVTLGLYSDSDLSTAVATDTNSSISDGTTGSVVYKKSDSSSETLYFGASASTNTYIKYVTISKSDYTEDSYITCTGTVSGIESDDTNVTITFTGTSDTVTSSVSDYTSTGVSLVSGDTYTVSAVGNYGVYKCDSITADSEAINLAFTRIEFDFPLDLINNFDDYSTYLTTKNYSTTANGSTSINDQYSNITVYAGGMIMQNTTYGAKTNSNNILSFTAESTGTVTVTVNVTACGNTNGDDTLQLQVNGSAAYTTGALSKGTVTLTASVSEDDTVLLYTPTRYNLYYSYVNVEYTTSVVDKIIETVDSVRYIIFGISDNNVEKASSFSVSKNGETAKDSENNDVQFNTVYKAVQFSDNYTKSASELLEEFNYVIAFKVSDTTEEASDSTVLDGFDLSFNY